jgi:IS5 family transposase
LADNLANVSGRVEQIGASGLGRSIYRRQLRIGEKSGTGIGKTKLEKAAKWMVVVDSQSVPLEKHLGSASPAEVKIAEITLPSSRVPNPHRQGCTRQQPQRLIADKAYDCDPQRTRLQKRGIELIVPHKANRVRKPTQDGRTLRSYRKR